MKIDSSDIVFSIGIIMLFCCAFIPPNENILIYTAPTTGTDNRCTYTIIKANDVKKVEKYEIGSAYYVSVETKNEDEEELFVFKYTKQEEREKTWHDVVHQVAK